MIISAHLTKVLGGCIIKILRLEKLRKYRLILDFLSSFRAESWTAELDGQLDSRVPAKKALASKSVVLNFGKGRYERRGSSFPLA